ncbi:cholinesterase 1-like [Haliotis rubra]|uniref:cholinesterase 1-like n=1 Tax=Haliotis rubra TaxID=36100 RepID=UPI001EE58C15|nr:cholinesterase 1-like [Haliotis rubra]
MIQLIIVSMLVLPAVGMDAPEINSTWGYIQGVERTSREGQPYFGYYGIPYAKPPVGDLRFRKPQPHPGVSDIFNATSYGLPCLQRSPMLPLNFSFPAMSEDCLTLNVFLPNTTDVSSSVPVMVWIHGGGFVYGSASLYEPWQLVTKGDVIVVTIQYRLGIFGFFSTGNDVAPGNYGLWDQHLALQWVKTNIEAFGGDSNNITIIGESAGAASVAYHVLYPGSKGLFQRAVLQSGAATSLWAINRNDLFVAMYVGYILGCRGGSGDAKSRQRAMVDCMRTNDSTRVLAYSYFGGTPAYEVIQYTWVPTIDGIFVKNDPQVLMRDITFLNTTCIKDIDVMVGANNNEGGLLLTSALAFDRAYNYTYATDIFKQKEFDTDILPTVTSLSLGASTPSINNIVSVEYTYPRPPSDQPLPQEQVLSTYGDPSFLVPGVLFARTHVLLNTSRKCYFYLFDHYPSFARDSPVKGMSHGVDTLYLFDLNPATVKMLGYSGNLTAEEYQVADTFVSFIADFAKTGNPNPTVEEKLGQAWPEFTMADQRYLSFTTNMSVRDHVYPRRVTLWLDIIPNLMKIPTTSTTSSSSTSTTTPTTSAPSTWFGLDAHTAEVTILALIVTLCVVGLLLVIIAMCYCLKRRKLGNERYALE